MSKSRPKRCYLLECRIMHVYLVPSNWLVNCPLLVLLTVTVVADYVYCLRPIVICPSSRLVVRRQIPHPSLINRHVTSESVRCPSVNCLAPSNGMITARGHERTVAKRVVVWCLLIGRCHIPAVNFKTSLSWPSCRWLRDSTIGKQAPINKKLACLHRLRHNNNTIITSNTINSSKSSRFRAPASNW